MVIREIPPPTPGGGSCFETRFGLDILVVRESNFDGYLEKKVNRQVKSFGAKTTLLNNHANTFL